jgi:predicted aldo/keto reductase-like oxidoreductase
LSSLENFDRFFCVGCGRCVRSCPVSMDIRTVFKEIGD